MSIKKELIIFIFLLFLVMQGIGAQGKTNQDNWEQLNKTIEGNSTFLKEFPLWLKPSSYRYDPVGKVDPFVPFINLQVLASRKKKHKSNALLSNFEVTQLRVVGILWNPKNPEQARAMIELPDGKGFILKLGMVIGRGEGKVIKITPDSVVVEEEILDIFGKVNKKQIVLKLHPKKGEE